jgi:hypothetical protein
VDFGGTIVLGVILLVVAVVWQAIRGQSLDPMAVGRTTHFRAISLAGGLALTGIGGFVAAHLAPGAEYRNALVMSIVSLALGAVITLAVPGEPEPLWYQLSSWGGILPTALFGAFVRVDTRPRRPPG